ncbi:hypothetical protein ALC60_08516 [Trachymyrmex zeteki]|uniref:Uncharacterized protein n=1 Tax=Mycetomoellerius zeteki TaxID=64791 RepID=A0A151WWT8_9HYME|nr:hypothetical protein ALC60_08516 [Trachymyrmex zeteki]
MYCVNLTYAMQAASSPNKWTWGFRIVVLTALHISSKSLQNPNSLNVKVVKQIDKITETIFYRVRTYTNSPLFSSTFLKPYTRIIAFLPLPKTKGKAEVGNEVACQEGSAEKLEELTVRESAQGDKINLIKVKVRALATTRELIVSQSLEQRFAPNVERGWAYEREEPFVCK